MQRGLSVEHHQVVILEVSLHLVAELQVKVAGFRVVAEVHTLSVVSDDVLGTGVDRVASTNQLVHPAAVTRGGGGVDSVDTLSALITPHWKVL